MDQRCRASGCKVKCHNDHLFCDPHWRLIPPIIKAALVNAYTVGQHKNPSLMTSAFVTALKTAVDTLAEIESNEMH